LALQHGAAPFESLAQVYRNGGYAPFLQAMRLAGSAPVPLVRFTQPGGAFPDPPTPDYTLAINERGGGRMRFDIGLGRRDVPFRRGDLVLKPPSVATFFANDGQHTKSFISLSPAMVGALARDAIGRDVPDFGRLHEGTFQSPVIARLLDLIWSETAIESPYSRLFNDGVVLTLVAALLRLARPEARRATAAPGLTQARLTRVRGWVADHIAEPFGLAEMASSVGLSPFHFSRAFKAATGQTPRAFVIACRIDHAKALLSGTALPLVEVAQSCGFADQAHFTTSFRRHVGMAPGAWRRNRR
jgi:AraC family transcriptional regulator